MTSFLTDLQFFVCYNQSDKFIKSMIPDNFPDNIIKAISLGKFPEELLSHFTQIKEKINGLSKDEKDKLLTDEYIDNLTNILATKYNHKYNEIINNYFDYSYSFDVSKKFYPPHENHTGSNMIKIALPEYPDVGDYKVYNLKLSENSLGKYITYQLLISLVTDYYTSLLSDQELLFVKENPEYIRDTYPNNEIANQRENVLKLIESNESVNRYHLFGAKFVFNGLTEKDGVYYLDLIEDI